MGANVYIEKKGYKAYIILNKPNKLNALDGEMYEDILGYLKELDTDSQVRVVIIKGNGRSFSAGFDIQAETDADINPLEERAGFQSCSNAIRWKMWELSKPVICQVQGHCLGGACEMMMPADFVVAADDAVIGEPQIQFGAASVFLMEPWLVGLRKSKEMMMLGETLSGKQAAESGLITKSVPLEQLENEVEAMADKLVKLPPEILFIQKLGINRQFEIMGFRAGIETWVEMSMLFRFFKTKEVEEFGRIAGEKGVKAALKWRDELYADKN